MKSFHKLYKLNHFIGSGFKSKVFTCQHLTTGKMYACKVVVGDYVPKSISDEQLSIMCNHENINNVKQVYYTLNENGDIVKYIISDLGEGDIYNYLEHNSFNITENTAKHLIKQMSSAVHYLHNKNICHRDIKLENFIYSRIDKNKDYNYQNINIKLIDFEFAVDCNNSEMKSRMGTKSYVAPELYNFKKYDTKIDIWSLGICSYILLSNRNPHNYYLDAKSDINFDINFNAIELKDKSIESIDFLKNLLQINPENRLDSKQVLDHNWLTDC